MAKTAINRYPVGMAPRCHTLGDARNGGERAWGRGGGFGRIAARALCVLIVGGLLGSCGGKGADPGPLSGAPAAGAKTNPAGPDQPTKAVKPTTDSPKDAVAKPGEPGAGQGEPSHVDAAPAPVPAPDPADAGACPEKNARGVGVMVSPDWPVRGEPVRVVAATFDGEEPLAIRIETDEGVQVKPTSVVHRRGVPSSAIVTLSPERAGRLRVVVGRNDEGLRCARFRVYRRPRDSKPRAALTAAIWPVKRAWNAAEEALFSAWIREMFHAPRGAPLAWKALDRVTSDPGRNLLHNSFGWGEDHPRRQSGLKLVPDCADTPYFLRAYFAWKRRLPFGARRCTRGRGGKAPRCKPLTGVLEPPEGESSYPGKSGELSQVQRYFRRFLASRVHTGNGRCAYGDNESDFYPLELSRRALRPGSIYADPYGHIFVVVELMDAQGKQPGVLYAIDGQPDGSITRKRYWEGNFLWNADPALGGSGFKAHRPLVVEGKGGNRTIRALTDDEIAKRRDYGDASDSQASLDQAGFYDTMDSLITPGKLDPFVMQEEVVRALFESARVRVTSVRNAEGYAADHRGETIEMPTGYRVFEVAGPWEDYSTPNRDLRLLIAIDAVANFDQKVQRRPDVYGVTGGPEAVEALRAELAAAREKLMNSKAFTFAYERSNGHEFELTLAELIRRAPALEVAYNPNDCPEVRWGAPPGSDEMSTCQRRAPTEQQAKVEAYRVWFSTRKRPARGDPGPKFELPEGSEAD